MAILQFRKKWLLSKVEATYGIDPALASPLAPLVSADAIETRGLSITRYDGPRISNEIDRFVLGGYADINVMPSAVLSFNVGMQGSNAAITKPAYDSLMQACGIAAVQNSPQSGGWKYSPISTAFKSVTLHHYQDGMRQVIVGARGNLAGSLTRGQLPVFTFNNLRGFYQRPTTPAPVNPTLTAYYAPIPVTFDNTPTFSFAGYAGFRLESFSFDFNNQISHHDTTNYREVFITNRAVTGQLSFSATDIATFDIFAKLESHASLVTNVLSIIHGITAGKIIKIDAPAVQIANISESDSDGVYTYVLDLKFLPVAGNDELTITTK